MNRSLPSLNSLRAFEAVARHLSYKAAAEELRVSPAAVKQLVGKLEASVGSPLLQRAGRGLALTPTGKAGLSDLSTAMQYITSSVQNMREPQNGKQLIITVESSFSALWLVPKLAEFSVMNPSYSVLIDSSPQIVDLDRSHVDVAIRYGVQSNKKLITHRLLDDQIFPACSPSLAKGPPALSKLEDLTTVPLIHCDMSKLDWARSSRQWFDWESWLAHVDADHIEIKGGIHFSDYAQAVQAAIAGQGVILASEPILRESIEAQLLVRPFPEKVIPNIGYDVVTTDQARNRPEVDAFIEWLLKTAGRK